MAIDSTIDVRRAILRHLATVPTVTKIVPASRHFPMTADNPAWPFILYGSPTPVPLRASCLDGNEITVAIHGFANARTNSAGAKLETAEDHAGHLGKVLAAALDRTRLPIPRGHAKIQWTGSQLLVDGAEADAFHVVVNLRIRCLTQ